VKTIKNLIIFLIFFSFIFILQIQNSYAWLSGFNYRRAITISNSGSTALTDYQVLITLDTASLIAAGKMRSDCGDIRITYYNSTDGTEAEIPQWVWTNQTNYTSLSYSWWMFGCNTTNTRITVKVPYIPASSTATIYIYYGNAQATSISSLKNIFTDSNATMPVTLPTRQVGHSCVSYKDSVYCFGGYNGSYLKTIVQYNTTSNTVTSIAELPYPLYYSSCVPYKDSIYCIGGYNGTSYTNKIIKYNITSNTTTILSTTFPININTHSCVPYQDSVYCFGGYNGNNYINNILKYNITSDTVTNTTATLPYAGSYSCVPYQDSVYCLGGYGGTLSFNVTVKYNITTNTVTNVGKALPVPPRGFNCVPFDNMIYCFGGSDIEATSAIQRYDIITNSTFVMNSTLPYVMKAVVCSVLGDAMYCFGGSVSGGGYSNMIFRYGKKYTSPEPSYSIGAEELPNQPPTITIYSPQNQTYFYSNNFIFNFSASDDRSTTFWVKAYLDDNLIYENTSYKNDTLVVLKLNLTQVKSYNLTVWANDTQGATSSLMIIFTIKDFEISSVEYEQYPYETKDYNYSITFRYNPDLVSNITSRLNYNNQYLVDANITFKNSTHIKNTATFTLPLIQQNNTQVSFKFVNVIYYTNNDFKTVESNIYNQNITFAYWIDSISSDRNDYIEFEDATINVYVKDKVGRASLSATITFIYNSTYNVSRDLLTYSTYSDLKIFNYTFDTLESFADNETRSYFANLTVSFQGNSRVMNSPVQQLKVYRIILTNCSIYTTKALTFYVKDEETDKPIQNATIEATFEVWKTGEIKRNYAWKFDLINTDNQSICIYPSWAEYSINAMLQYYKSGYMDRTYYIYTKINNKTSSVNLYLLDVTLGSVIIVYVTDENGNRVQGAVVKIQRYYVGYNSYKTVAQVKTDYEGKGVTFLRVNEIYYRFIIEKNFVVVRETEPTIITCTAGGCPPYPVTLSISEQKPAKYFRYIGKIAYACQINEETNILKCTVDDTSQLMQKARLLVEQKGALKFDTLCDNICESSACTLICDLGNRTNNIYRYILSAYIPEQIILDQNILDYKQALISWGAEGLLITFLLTSTLFFVGIWNPVVSMVFALLGIIAGYLLGFTPVSTSSLIGLALAVGILIYKLRA